MGVLLYVPGQTRHHLGGRLIIGRAESAGLRLNDGRVSGEHAVISWHGPEGWMVQDLGSRNGTWVNAERLTPGARSSIGQGDDVYVAGRRHLLRLVDPAPPRAGAVSSEGTFVAASCGVLLLPDEESPDLAVFEDVDGSWFAEIGDRRASVADHDTLVAGGLRWRLTLPVAQRPTEDASGAFVEAPGIGLHFVVSPDEEHVEITVLRGAERVALAPRSHAYVLLTLARERLGDREEGVVEEEQGWVYRDTLAQMLGCSTNTLGVSLFRARHQLAEAGIQGVGDLIEVRPVIHKLRIGVSNLIVERR